MPKIPKYLESYRLYEGLILEGWRLQSIDIDHIPVLKYKTYRYPTKLYWKATNKAKSTKEFMERLRQYLSNHVIYTQYGNPYYCKVMKLKLIKDEDGSIFVDFTGICNRISRRD